MPKNDMPALKRTSDALAFYDRLSHQFNKCSNANIVAMFNKLEDAGKRVGHAFGLDTADRNALDTCEQVIRPCPWIRQIVAEWKASQTLAKTDTD